MTNKETEIEEIVEEFKTKFPDPMTEKYGKGFALYCSFCAGQEPIIDWLRTTLTQYHQDMMSEVVEKVKGLEQENNYSTAYADWTPERAIEKESKTQGYNQAINDIIYKVITKKEEIINE